MPKAINSPKSRKRPGKALILTAVIYKEGRWYVAECPEVGTASQDKTIEESLFNLKEATELYLEEFPPKATSRPLLTTFEAAYA